MPFLKSLKLDGILSFPPGSEAIPLTPLNILIGPNGSGKSNLIEGVELLHALPTGLAAVIRRGGGVREWLWKGIDDVGNGLIDARLNLASSSRSRYGTDTSGMLGLTADTERGSVDYYLSLTSLGQRLEITGERIQDATVAGGLGTDGDSIYYSMNDGNAEVRLLDQRDESKIPYVLFNGRRTLARNSLKSDESVLSQLRDPQAYPELTEIAQKFAQIYSFRDWTIGRDAEVRKPQPTDLPNDSLLPDSRNLGLILNRLEHSGAWSKFNDYLSRFLPRFQRFSTRIEGGTVQFYLHEEGLKAPVPATRLSDGTIRFMAILAQLLSPTPPPLICMEEPELGLHPDAITLLANLLQEASSRTQLIVTTHSDILLSALTEVADSVLVCEYRNGTVLQRVESSELRFWLDKYRLGEIWRIGQLGGNV